MIKNIEIWNFKSIKHLKLDCKRINIFIGEPNTGKSNILETLGLFSHVQFHMYGKFRTFVRFEIMNNLFYDGNLDDKIKIKLDDKILEIKFEEGVFKGEYVEEKEKLLSFAYDHTGTGTIPHTVLKPSFKFYRFAVKEKFPVKQFDSLLPPSGENLLALLLSHKELKSLVGKIFAPFGLELVFRPHEDKIEIQKRYEDIIISYPYSLTSETLQRIIFYLTAISSNKDSIIAFEEPEAHAFPYYTKYLAETVALDKSENQYFISTHNPYFLLSILEKSPEKDLNIFVTSFKNYQTKIKLLTKKEMEEITQEEMDIFFNLDKLLT